MARSARSRSRPTASRSPPLASGKKVKVNYPSPQSQLEYQRVLEAENVTFDSKGTGTSTWWALLTGFLPFLLLIGFWIFLMNQMQGGGSKVMSFGKSRAKRMSPTRRR